jgi:hypothetical protein
MGEVNQWGAPQIVEFNNPKDCIMVHHMMHDHGMKFAEAIDYLELRKDYHFTVRAETASDRDKF